MQSLIIGGSASGKSAYAEGLAMAHGGNLVYIATMRPFGPEAEWRIMRHRAMRRGKGFSSVECYTDVGQLSLSQGSTVLLECLGNLVANELFTPGVSPEEAERKVIDDIETLGRKADHLVVVSNDIFCDGTDYDLETRRYMAMLGRINAAFAGRVQRVIEVVCGIPVWHKGEVR